MVSYFDLKSYLCSRSGIFKTDAIEVVFMAR